MLFAFSLALNIVILNHSNFLKTPSFIRFASLEMKEYECEKDTI